MNEENKQITKTRLLSEQEVIKEGGYPFTLSWLRSMRVRGGGIPFIKIGSRVFYTPEDIEAYIATKRVSGK